MVKSEIYDWVSLCLRCQKQMGHLTGDEMKYLSLLMWVGQFGFSCLFPTCAFLILGMYLQQRFGLGVWVVIVLGAVGLLTSIRTARVCLHSMRKEIDRISKDR